MIVTHIYLYLFILVLPKLRLSVLRFACLRFAFQNDIYSLRFGVAFCAAFWIAFWSNTWRSFTKRCVLELRFVIVQGHYSEIRHSFLRQPRTETSFLFKFGNPLTKIDFACFALRFGFAFWVAFWSKAADSLTLWLRFGVAFWVHCQDTVIETDVEAADCHSAIWIAGKLRLAFWLRFVCVLVAFWDRPATILKQVGQFNDFQ